jgi:hypothetical protein
MERVIQYEIALINQDHNLLHWVVDNPVDCLRHSTVFQGSQHHDVTTINNKTAFCEHHAGVFHYNVLQLQNKLLHIKMCVSSLCHSLRYFLIKIKYVCLILERKSTVLIKVQLSCCVRHSQPEWRGVTVTAGTYPSTPRCCCSRDCLMLHVFTAVTDQYF